MAEGRAAVAAAGVSGARRLERYQRQMILPQVGVAGQERLLRSRVLVVGAGALGSASALYLAAAGVGTVGIVDGDRVAEHNLHRQVLHGTADVGRPKTESGAERLAALNGDVRVVQHQAFLAPDNALDLVGRYDLVVNGSDNFATRYLVNDACVLLARPLVDAAILRFEGQFVTFRPGQGCYRCLFPTPPPPGSVPDCAEAGVFGALAGVFGSLQAVEAIKLLLGLAEGRPRLSMYDALAGEWRAVAIRRDPLCPLCGDRPTITALLADYEVFCGVTPVAAPADVPSLSARDAAAWLEAGRAVLVDVRNPSEIAAGRVPGSLTVPLPALDPAAAIWPSDRAVICVCAMGARSAQAAARLRAAGVNAFSLAGGVLAWQAEGLPWQGPAAERA